MRLRIWGRTHEAFQVITTADLNGNANMKKKNKTTRNVSLAIIIGVCVISQAPTQAMAMAAPDSFREKVVTATLACYGVFDVLADKDWPGRDEAEVYELKRDAREKRDYSLGMLKRYSAAYSDFDINAELRKAEMEAGTRSMSKEQVLDMAVYCEKELFKLIDQETQNDYTP